MVHFKDVSYGNSNYRFIPEFWRGNIKISNDRPIHRLCNLMRKLDAGTAVVEDLQEDYYLVRDELNALRRYFDYNITFQIFRITFLVGRITKPDDLLIKNPTVLSNAIIINYKHKRTWASYLYSSIVTVPFWTIFDTATGKQEQKSVFNAYVHMAKTFSSEILLYGGSVFRYKIFGNYFAQQNRKTSVCAHVALCMTFNNLKTRKRKMLSPEEINKALGINHENQKIGKKFDFHVNTVSDILRTFDFSVVTSQYTKANKDEDTFFAYRYIEGRCPSMLVFEAGQERHIVPVVGHTIDTDLWSPEAERAYTSRIGKKNYTSAAAWVDNYIIHDDNYGMYVNFPSEKLKSHRINSDPLKVLLCLSIVPDSVIMPSNEIEWVNIFYLESLLAKYEFPHDAAFWINRLKESVFPKRARTPFVARTFLVDKKDYMNSLKKKNFYDEALSAEEVNIISKDLPAEFWLTEISLPDLFNTNQSKIADLACRADISLIADDPEEGITGNLDQGLLFARFPGVIFVSNGGDVEVLRSSSKNHVPVFNHPGELKPYFW